ncbi:MAG: TrbG/VirB9 family P-type conjugative transfer protein [Novosphingobium sp.]|nr:TrbG/VirB9 family P-type conjugative transfer protein [Novosphingobium sp.]MCP5402209.1 TrbG/VirB9 family P-type conjugative transfer protein [Novosphingobium sp.]
MKMKTLLPLSAALLAFTSPVWAEDARLVTHMYDSDEVVHIDGKLGVQATIGFGEGEHIENVAVGDSEKWQITPNKRANLLFVKPLAANARTNMTVVTDRHTYFFDLVASPRGKPVYMLRFAYPESEQQQAPQQAELASLNDAERALMEGDPVVAPADPATLNFAWEQRGSPKLLPARVYDDGNATYLLWGDKQDVPAILVRNEKGEEGPVNYAVRGRAIVIDDVPELILLRSGKAQATLANRGEPRQVAASTPSARTQSPSHSPVSQGQ